MGTGTGMALAVIDIGTPPAAGGIGWCVASGAGLRRRESGRDLDRAVRAVATQLSTGPVALGFAAPAFVPRIGTGPPRSSAGAARSAPLGISVATVVYTLRELKRLVPEARARLDWRRAPAAPGDLLLFEALVAGPTAGADREADASAAVRRAAKVLGTGHAADGAFVAAETQLFSPVGVALVRARWCEDLAVLGEPCLVVCFRRPRPRRVGTSHEASRISMVRDAAVGAQPIATA